MSLPRFPRPCGSWRVLSVLTGVAYPLAVTGLARLAFRGGPAAASCPGRRDTRFRVDRPAVRRPALLPMGGRVETPLAGKQPVVSGGSNDAPSNPRLARRVATLLDGPGSRGRPRGRAAAAARPWSRLSGSGLDPHVRPGGSPLAGARVGGGARLERAEVEALVRRDDRGAHFRPARRAPRSTSSG